MSGHPPETPPRKRARLHSLKRPRAGLQRPPMQTPNATRLRSLADMLGAASSRAEIALGDDAPEDAWTVVQSTMDNLASLPPPDPSRSVAPPPRPHSDPLAPAEMAVEGSFSSLPLDRSVKIALRVVSNSQLFWTLSRSPRSEYLALSGLVGADEVHEDGEHASAKQTLFKAMLHFRCPAAPLPATIATQWQALIDTPATSARRDSTKGVRSLALQRLTTWHSSLQSLYFAFRHGHISQFYVLLSTTAVLFTHKDHLQDSRQSHASQERIPRAHCSSATVGLRSLLREYAVPYAMMEGAADQLPGLIIKGQIATHALYNFVLSAGPRLANATDVPILLCDQPFRGCTIASAEIFNSHKTRVANDSTDLRYSVQMSGLFTPRQITGICEALQLTQDGDFSLFLETDGRSARLNDGGRPEDSEKDWRMEDVKISDGVLQGAAVLSRVESSKDGAGYSIVTRASD